MRGYLGLAGILLLSACSAESPDRTHMTLCPAGNLGCPCTTSSGCNHPAHVCNGGVCIDPNVCTAGTLGCTCDAGNCDAPFVCEGGYCVDQPACPIGSEGCSCTQGGACDPELECVQPANTCIDPGNCPIGSYGCPCTGGGFCDGTLICVQGLCDSETPPNWDNLPTNADGMILELVIRFPGHVAGLSADSTLLGFQILTVSDVDHFNQTVQTTEVIEYIFEEAGSALMSDGITPYQDGQLLWHHGFDGFYEAVPGFDPEIRVGGSSTVTASPSGDIGYTDEMVIQASAATLVEDVRITNWIPEVAGQFGGAVPAPFWEGGSAMEFFVCTPNNFVAGSSTTLAAARHLLPGDGWPYGTDARITGWCEPPESF